MLFFNRLWHYLAYGAGLYAFVCLVAGDWSGGLVVSLAGACFLLMTRLSHDVDVDTDS